MSNIACIPIIGPFFNLYRIIETRSEYFSAIMQKMDHCTKQIIEAGDGFQAQDWEKVSRAGRELQKSGREMQEEEIRACEKSDLYITYGVFGNVAIIAAAIGLFAVGILNGVSTITIASFCTFHAFLLSRLDHRNYEMIESIKF